MSVLATLFPETYLRYQTSKRKLARYQAACERKYSVHSTFRQSHMDVSSADATVEPAIEALRAKSRHLVENHDLYVAMLQEFVDQVVGAGLHVEAMGVSNTGRRLKRWNDDVQRVISDWAEHPEATGEICWSEAQRRLAWAWAQDGEVFVRHITSNGYPWARDQVRYVFQQLEADYCPMTVRSVVASQGQVTQGIKHDAWGRPTSFLFFREHPGDLNHVPHSNDLLEIPASEVTHLKFVRRWPQTRGVPFGHSVFNRLDDIHRYEVFEMQAAKTGATMAAFIQRDAELADPTANATGDQQTYDLSGNSVYELLPGETVGSVSAERPNPELTNFRASQLRAACAGFGVMYSPVARDFNSSYSASRQELVIGEKHYQISRELFTAQAIRPIIQNVIRAAIRARRLELPTQTTFERATRIEVNGDGVAWIDPLKEAQADVLLVDSKLASRRQILRKRGTDPVQLAAQLKIEAEESNELSSQSNGAASTDTGGADNGSGDEEQDGDGGGINGDAGKERVWDGDPKPRLERH